MGLSCRFIRITVFACESPHHIAIGSGFILSAGDVLSVIANGIATAGKVAMNGGGQVLLMIGPMIAQKMASDGYDKQQIWEELHHLARKSVSLMKSNKFLNPEHPFL